MNYSNLLLISKVFALLFLSVHVYGDYTVIPYNTWNDGQCHTEFIVHTTGDAGPYTFTIMKNSVVVNQWENIPNGQGTFDDENDPLIIDDSGEFQIAITDALGCTKILTVEGECDCSTELEFDISPPECGVMITEL